MYIGFPGLRNVSPFRLQKQSTLLSGDAVKELLFLRQLWCFILPSKVMPCFPVFEDNQGAVQLALNPGMNSNSKHIDVRHHFLRELVVQRDIKVMQVPSEFQYADILTKALAYDLFAFHQKILPGNEFEVIFSLNDW